MDGDIPIEYLEDLNREDREAEKLLDSLVGIEVEIVRRIE